MMKQILCIILISLLLILVACHKQNSLTELAENSSIEQIVKGKVKVPIKVSVELAKYIQVSKYLKCVLETDENGVKKGTTSINIKLADTFKKDVKFSYKIPVTLTVLDKNNNEILREQKSLNLDYLITWGWCNRLASTNSLPALIKIVENGDIKKVEKPKKKQSGKKPTNLPETK